jgi:hypothetical protein
MSRLTAGHVGAGRQEEDKAETPRFLLLASGRAAEDAAHALELYLHARVQLAADPLACLRALQGEAVTLLVVEESVAEADGAAIEAVYEAAGDAVLLEVNLGIVDAARFVRQVRAALRQRNAEKERAKAAVRAELRQELVASPTLQRLVGLAEHLCGVLRDPQSGTETAADETSIRTL